MAPPFRVCLYLFLFRELVTPPYEYSHIIAPSGDNVNCHGGHGETGIVATRKPSLSLASQPHLISKGLEQTIPW